MVHNPPYENWDLTLSIGNTLAYEACLRTLCNKGDSIIMEEYAYTSSIFATRSQFPVSPFKATSCVLVLMGRPQGVKIVGIGTDGNGMRADLLDQKLTNWDANDGRKPRVAYIVPYYPSPAPLFQRFFLEMMDIALMVELDRILLVRVCSLKDGRNYILYFRTMIF